MAPALEWQDPPRDKGAHDVIGHGYAGFHEHLDVPADPVCFRMALSRVVAPVLLLFWWASYVCRQIDEVFGAGVLDIKEGPLPFPA
jgi:hypothetical protein